MQQNIQNNSIGPIGLLWVALIVLKLMEVIHWSWWIIIFFPLWSVLTIVAGCGVLACLLGGMVWAGDKLLN